MHHRGVRNGYLTSALQWRHNGRDNVSNHQPHDCLLNRLFRRRSKKTSKLRVTGLCAGNSPVTDEFPPQMASYAENVSVWWRHHGQWRRACNESPPFSCLYGCYQQYKKRFDRIPCSVHHVNVQGTASSSWDGGVVNGCRENFFECGCIRDHYLDTGICCAKTYDGFWRHLKDMAQKVVQGTFAWKSLAKTAQNLRNIRNILILKTGRGRRLRSGSASCCLLPSVDFAILEEGCCDKWLKCFSCGMTSLLMPRGRHRASVDIYSCVT